jgi:cation-transporting ATPase E
MTPSPSSQVQAASPPNLLTGLSQADAEARAAQGLVNTLSAATARTYLQIARDDIFTFFNIVLFGLGIALIVLGQPTDTLVAVGVVLVNVVVSVVQEVRAKHLLDRIALLTRPHATVIRDGQAIQLAPDRVVLGDLLVAHAGDQFVVDGPVVSGQAEVDESLLTGEADAVTKTTGDLVSSGTFCLSGTVSYRAERVGPQSAASQLTRQARAVRQELTPLQRDVNLIIQLLLLVATFFEILVVGNAIIDHISVIETVRRSVVVLAIIPVGLFLAISVAYALGAVRLAGHGALIQQANAIESLSHVDVLCLDKTGTLTANALAVQEIIPLGVDAEHLVPLLAAYAASTTSPTKTTEAIAAAYPGPPRLVATEIPFSSARKWSALAWKEQPQEIIVLGAPELLLTRLSPDAQGAVQTQLTDLTERGLRVVLLAGSAGVPLSEKAGSLPAPLTALGLIALRDTLRPEAQRTLAEFARVGVQVKIISGDHPSTVAAVVKQAGIAEDARCFSGAELANLDDEQIAQAAEDGMIFGRITPEQKAGLVRALRSRGHYVAMIGDGVNDVLSLKHANIGIAMQSGSQATRSVADLVLLQNSFAPLPRAFREGQRIQHGLHQITSLFLARVLFLTIMILSVVAITDSFAFTPKQNSLLAFLTGGVPALALVVWARPRRAKYRSLFRELLRVSVPASLIMSLLGIGIFIGFSALLGSDPGRSAQTTLTDFGVLCGLLLMLYVAPPAPFWAVCEPLEGDWRPTWLAGGLSLLFLAILAIPGLRSFFDLASLSPGEGILLIGLVGAWLVLTHLIWKTRLLERFLHLE